MTILEPLLADSPPEPTVRYTVTVEVGAGEAEAVTVAPDTVTVEAGSVAPDTVTVEAGSAAPDTVTVEAGTVSAEGDEDEEEEEEEDEELSMEDEGSGTLVTCSKSSPSEFVRIAVPAVSPSTMLVETGTLVTTM